MLRHRIVLADERGIALPLGLIVLMLLASLMVAFAAMSATEPMIASNAANTNRALYYADSGVERAVWALSHPIAASGIAQLANVPAPYNNALPHTAASAFIALGQGGFTVTVAAVPGSPTQAQVTSTGWLPTNAAPTAKKIVTTRVLTLQNRLNPPGALNVDGPLTVSGSTDIDTRTGNCQTTGWQLAAFTTGATTLTPSNAKLYGSNQPSPPPGYNQPYYDYRDMQPASAFAPLMLSPNELVALKAKAQAAGTYFRPAADGTLTFDTPANPLPASGIVFVDTVSGLPIGNPPNPADLAKVTINTASSSGWLVVMGSITFGGTSPVNYTGLVYAANGFTYSNTGGGTGIRGAVISGNVTAPTSSVAGTTRVRLDCDAINNNAGPNWVAVPGTWRELGG